MPQVTIAQLIGQNARRRRDELGMTAAELGRLVGDAFGKPWPRQTVYLMESGERAMVAAEVAVIASVLGTTVAKLFAPGEDPVLAGFWAVDPAVLSGGNEPPALEPLAGLLRELEQASQDLGKLSAEQASLVARARDALTGIDAAEIERQLRKMAQPSKREGEDSGR
jgi:transcriptional regulator with XRE-family HTH domain